MSEFRVFCGGPRCATLECVVGAAHDDANRRTATQAARPTGLQKKAIEGDFLRRSYIKNLQNLDCCGGAGDDTGGSQAMRHMRSDDSR